VTDAPGDRDDPPPAPHPSRLDPRRPDYAEILARHRRSAEAGAAAYRDPATGSFVMTAAYLAARGSCCDNGCRHCPYVGTTGADATP